MFYFLYYFLLERIKGVEFHASEIQKLHKETIEWKGVKKINNIEYVPGHITPSGTTPTEIRTWNAWKIGPGKKYQWNDMEQTVKEISPLNVFYSTNISASWITDSYEKGGNIVVLLLKK